MTTWPTIVFSGLLLALTAIWMVWTIRQAVIARRGPSDDAVSYHRHYRVTGAVAMFVAVVGVVLTAAIMGTHPIAIWPGAIAGVLVLIACESRWPRPSGSVRSAVIAPRHGRDLVPWFSTCIAAIGLLMAGVVIGVCWMLGNSPGGRTISGNVVRVSGDMVATVANEDGFPGWPVGLITALGGVVLLLIVGFGWHFVARRPALREVPPADDLRFRRASIDRMMRIVGIAALATANEFYAGASSAYSELQWKLDPMGSAPAEPYGWLSGTCAVLILLTFTAGVRPRLRQVQPAKTTAAQV